MIILIIIIIIGSDRETKIEKNFNNENSSPKISTF